MPIRVMISESDARDERGDLLDGVEEVTDYPGFDGVLYMQTTLVGLVLHTGERNGYHDSDFTATYWDEEQGRPEAVTYASTRGWTYPNSATPDATDEVRAAYTAWCDARDRRLAQEASEAREAGALATARYPKKGAKVRVVKGRKVPVGTVGTVFWLGAGNYGERVGIVDRDGVKHWTAADNCNRILPSLDDAGVDSWVDFVREEREGQPYKGQRWASLCGRHEGTVFWVSDDRDRIGLRVGSDKDAVVWLNATDAERVN